MYVPGEEYVCEGLIEFEIFPSPKFHETLVPTEEKFVKVIVWGAHPEIIFVLKNEITLFLFTVIDLMIESIPQALDTINFILYVVSFPVTKKGWVFGLYKVDVEEPSPKFHK